MKFILIFLTQIILLIKVICDKNNTEKNDIDPLAVYRIDSISNNYALTDEDYYVQFCKAKDKRGQMFKFRKTGDNTYNIEGKKNGRKLGVNQNGHSLFIFNLRDKSLRETLNWNIYKIDENQYIIKNTKFKKFLEINSNFLQCMNDLPAPYEEHKSEIGDNFKFNLFKLYEEVNITSEHLEKINNEPIDVVIKYIDLSDKTLIREGIKQIQKDEDNEELRYSVRSILKYIPWVRKIFILMPNEKVRYFKPYDKIKEKIVYVKDKDLLGYDSANIYAFTFNLFRLENFGLSENFIYFDDDFFVGKSINKSQFFYYDENEKKVVPSLMNNDFCELDKNNVLYRYKYYFKARSKIGPQTFIAWILSLLSTEKFFLDYYQNITLVNPTPTHNAIPYNIKDLKEIYDLVVKNYEYANETLNSIQRHILTLQTQHFVDLYTLNIKKRKVHSINYNVIPMDVLKPVYMYIELYAINTGGDKVYKEEEYKRQKEIMKLRYPDPTPYEIEEKEDTKNVKRIKRQNVVNEVSKSSNDNNEGKNEVMVLNKPEDSKLGENNEIEFKINTLLQINKKQAFIIKLSNSLIVLMLLLIISLFYLYLNEKKQSKYSQISDMELPKY